MDLAKDPQVWQHAKTECPPRSCICLGAPLTTMHIEEAITDIFCYVYHTKCLLTILLICKTLTNNFLKRYAMQLIHPIQTWMSSKTHSTRKREDLPAQGPQVYQGDFVHLRENAQHVRADWKHYLSAKEDTTIRITCPNNLNT